jgi:hypothetical protein
MIHQVSASIRLSLCSLHAVQFTTPLYLLTCSARPIYRHVQSHTGTGLYFFHLRQWLRHFRASQLLVLVSLAQLASHSLIIDFLLTILINFAALGLTTLTTLAILTAVTTLTMFATLITSAGDPNGGVCAEHDETRRKSVVVIYYYLQHQPRDALTALTPYEHKVAQSDAIHITLC